MKVEAIEGLRHNWTCHECREIRVNGHLTGHSS